MVTALALHPSARRKLVAKLPAPVPHDVVLRPLGGGGPAMMVVSADEQSFIDAVLADAEREDWQQMLAARRGIRRGSDGVLELSQPVHRRFHLVLVEAQCRQPGSPRIDPKKLDGMGLVLRRRENGVWQGWMSEGAKKRGWVGLSGGDLDPDTTRRQRLRIGAAGQIEELLAARRGSPQLAEDVLPLFVAPPELCAKLGRTLLYGLVPVTSGERSEVSDPAPDYTALPADEAKGMRDHLSEYLKARPKLAMPRAQSALDPTWKPLTSTDGQLQSFGTFLQQLQVELGAFEGGPAAENLLATLAKIRLPMERNAFGQITQTMTAATFVTAAARILISGEGNTGGLRMPIEWPTIDAALGAQLTQASLACLSQRFVSLSSGTPKFDGDGRQYAVRTFIRVKGHDNCPPTLVWSDYSEAFRILPWWEGEGPATKISLPSISDFKRLKPNVSFELPPSLANLLQKDMKKLADGDGSTGGIDIFWLCSFSLPIITLCAFIVLNIFLSLFDLFLGWLAFIKICIPIPKPK